MHPQARSLVRRARAGLVVCLAAALLVLTPEAGGPLQGQAAAATTPPPTIILITTDDQTLEDMTALPQVRELIGGAGVTFSQAISPQPLCCPARATVMSGQYAHNNGVRHNDGFFGGYGRFASYNGGIHLRENLGVWLQRSGYATAMIGKMLNKYQLESRRPRGWTLWSPLVGRIYNGYGSTFLNDDNRTKYYANVHSADATTKRVLGFLNRTHDVPRPTFVWASYVAPHGVPGGGGGKQAVPARRHEGFYGAARTPASTKPSYPWAAGSKPDLRMQRKHRSRLASLRSVDEGVAAIVARLRAQGRLAGATIIFTSDNGYLLGEHGRVGKNSHYRESLAVPLLMRSPQVPAGVSRAGVASLVDLPATILDLAGARSTSALDGVSLLPYAQGSATLPETTLIQAGTSDAAKLRSYGWYFRGVMSARYTYAYFWNGREVLVDRQRDPYELRNLVSDTGQATDMRYQSVLAELRRRAQSLSTCTGAACRAASTPLPPA